MKMTPRLEQAMQTATVAHRNQVRKGSEIPYIVHPMAVMCIASTATEDEDVLVASLFHDIFEDVPEAYPRERMVKEFGKRVVSIVDGVTKDDTIKGWKPRADAYLHHLEHEASDESVIVSAADKAHNLLSILFDYKTLGNELWSRFKVGKDEQLWWYESILGVTSRRLPDMPINDDLAELVNQMRVL
jgi:(p)ppGpp synthase/HD superfamily hydrolase